MPFWAPYVPVAQRRAQARRKMETLRKKGQIIEPIEIEGRTIARSFWGKGWCSHLESFSDFANRLPRGRTYVRNGSVCHLAIHPGHIEAIVSGSELYNVRITIKKLKPSAWQAVRERCSGRIGSMLELLQGKFSDHVMSVVTDRVQGLFPHPREIQLSCNCPDWAVMCKHVAAVLYGVGSRLDDRPELLFLLRDVDAQELISAEMTVPETAATGDVLEDDRLGDIFDIDLDVAGEASPAREAGPTNPRRVNGRKKPGTSDKPAPPSRNANRQQASSRNGRAASSRARRKATRSKKSSPGDANKRSSTAASTSALPTIRPTGKSVARLRRRLGLSVAQFARQLNVSAASVYRWEATAGRLNLQAGPLAALAELERNARDR